MPFGYFGAKNGLARYYPPPRYPLVIEPFAGAAGYTCYWARHGRVDHAILVDVNPHLVALWHRLQAMTAHDIHNIVIPPVGSKTRDPLVANGDQMMALLRGAERVVTSRMIKDRGHTKSRLLATQPHWGYWDISCGDYTSCPDYEATWFIDPPYRPRPGSSGKMTAGGYSYRTAALDYDKLADWCLSRKGQVIVCEQMPADWLPFEPFRRQNNAVGRGTRAIRTEAVFTFDT